MGEEKPIDMVQCLECQAYCPEIQIAQWQLCMQCVFRLEEEHNYQYED